MATERTVLVRLKADAGAFNRGLMEAAAGVSALRKEINTTNERTAWLTQGILAIAPALVPLGAAAVPVFSGLATQMTVGAAAAGVLALGFNGIGGALKALNDYQIDPTDAHLKKLRITMSQLSSEGQDFVTFLDSLQPIGKGLQNTAQAGMFPGIESGLERLVRLAPQVKRIVHEIALGIGQLADEGGGAIAGPKFRAFFDFLEHGARPILIEMGHTLGHFAAGLANLFVAFLPESEKFSAGFEKMSESFEKWTAGLSKTQGFKDFLAYVDQSGPQALDFIGALSEAIIALVHAAAPVGSVMLPLFTDLLRIFADVADTPLGSTFLAIAAAMSLYGRAAALTSNVTGSNGRALGMADKAALKAAFSFRTLGRDVSVYARSALTAGAATEKMTAQTSAAGAGIRKWGASAAKVGGQAALLGFAVTGLADKIGLGNTSTLALAGSLAGPWGAAAGAAVGLFLDLNKSSNSFKVSVDDVTDTLNKQTGAITQNTRAYINKTLVDQGVLKDAAALGLNLQDVTRAALGNEAALGRVNTAMRAKGQLDNDGANAAMHLKNALDGTNSAVADAKDKWSLYNAGMGRASAGSSELAGRQKMLAAQIRASRQAAATTAKQFITLGDDLDNAKVSLDKWIRELAQQAQALVNFGNNAKRAADKGLRQGLISALNEAGPAGAMRMRQLANATQSEIARANQAWGAGQRAIKAYTNQVGGVPNSKTTKINLDANAAVAELLNTRSIIDSLPSVKNIHINVTRSTNANLADVTRADGGPIPGPRYPYGDKVLAFVAPGEEIISNRYGQADRYRRDRDMGRIPRYADGGTVASTSTHTGGDSGVADAASRAAHAMGRLQHSVDAAKESVDKEKAARDAVRQKMQEVSSNVTGGFRSDFLDVENTNPWASGSSSSPFGILRGNIRDARAYRRALADLKRRGVSGNFAAQIDTLNAAQQVDALSNRQLHNLEHLFAVRQHASAAAGQLAGQTAYGAQLREANAELHHANAHLRSLEHEMKHMRAEAARHAKDTADGVGKHINGASGRAARRVRNR